VSTPILTVVVLAVLWLIVLVPMIVQRGDDRAQNRSVEGWGRAMSALSRQPAPRSTRQLGRADPAARTTVLPRVSGPRSELFVPGRRPAPRNVAPVTRHPVPAAKEALMYPVDRSEMSPARRAMLDRRKHSLAVLIIGSLIAVGLALAFGGPVWVLAVGFLAGLGGYLVFLRRQVVQDRDRRAGRLARAASRESFGYDATAAPLGLVSPMLGADVSIDDDDLSLETMDTIDLTGLYQRESEFGEAVLVDARRAS